MSHRFPCKHEQWARRSTTARAPWDPPVMGSNPPCPWCARESGSDLALEVAVNVAVAAEREACAKLIEAGLSAPPRDGWSYVMEYAAAIRTRGGNAPTSSTRPPEASKKTESVDASGWLPPSAVEEVRRALELCDELRDCAAFNGSEPRGYILVLAKPFLRAVGAVDAALRLLPNTPAEKEGGA